MMVKCVDCNRERSEKYMEQAVFRDPYWIARDVPAGVYRCASRAACRRARKESRNDYANGHTYDRT